MRSACSTTSSANALPTVPRPSTPIRNTGGSRYAAGDGSVDIAAHQVLVALPAHHDTRVAFPAEDHRRPGDAVVVVGHRVAVGARGGGHHDVTGAGTGQRDVAHDHVTGLAVLAGQVTDVAGGGQHPVGDGRLVPGAVEHRPEVVRHAAVHRNPGRDVALHGLDRIQRDG